MFERTVRYLYTGLKRASLRYYAVLIACALLVFVWNSPAVHVEAAMKHPPTKAAVAPLDPDSPRFDVLRREAASGDERSNRELTTALLDRYDQTGNSDDLYEALIWVDKRWNNDGKAELAARVTAQYCGQRVVQWHWLCAFNE